MSSSGEGERDEGKERKGRGKANSEEEGGREENGQGKERRMERDMSEEDGRLEREGIDLRLI